jgi:hypothetical protein
MSMASPNTRTFLTTGMVLAWVPATRVLYLAGQRLWVAPDVSVEGVALGVVLTALGHEDSSGRRVVTRIERIRRNLT